MRRIITAAAVAATAVIGLAAPAVSFAAPTASISEAQICAALDRVPSIALLALTLYDEGYSADQVGSLIASSVINTCPRHMALLEDFVLRYA